jgi:hypothetical protein
VAFFICCCPCIAAGLHASLDRRCVTYALIRGTLSGVIPPYQASHLAISPSGMVDVSQPPIGKGNVMEDLRVSPCGVRHSLGSMRSFDYPGSLKKLMSGGLINTLISQLWGESLFRHIQTSVSERLKFPSDSPQIGNRTPSLLCLQPWSTSTMSHAVPGPTPNQSCSGLLTCHCIWMC